MLELEKVLVDGGKLNLINFSYRSRTFTKVKLCKRLEMNSELAHFLNYE